MHTSESSQYLTNPLNTSTSKAQFSFPKAKRFQDPKPETHHFYNIPNTLTPRSTTFGYGHKYDFTSDKEKTPDPGSYKVENDILDKAKGFKFGISRNDCKNANENHFIGDPSIPGPGAYEFSPKFGREGRIISISGKKNGLILNSISPGPGAYDQSHEKHKGEYVLSNYKSAASVKISTTSNRFAKEHVEQTPSPGTYNLDKGFLKNSQVLSTIKNSGGRMFAKSERKPLILQSYSPGPGYYSIPSDFSSN